ncbi:hypothetical protein [Roseovarius atlanticus]|uniref:hypothetical protein n=1 Tax=Roseovarius atlanticus TaxID=1641875 RepID=UPI001C97740C|nr:hypothetical protein [Roseovarius atlanticus]MBY5989141.1 hypothetical protein [Roseovarius atlanticus]MBY6124533.1 hypothetical protein [Roseovarius atlanticus]MBY6149028.1 hypothetical protein [Roseovarius atlanticus]
MAVKNWLTQDSAWSGVQLFIQSNGVRYEVVGSKTEDGEMCVRMLSAIVPIAGRFIA